MATILTIKFEPAIPLTLTNGYAVGGADLPTYQNLTDSFPFSSSFTTATDVGNLTVLRRNASGHSSNVEGFTAGGINVPGTPSPFRSDVDKFPFASPFTSTTSVGSLVPARRPTGVSSSTDGYAISGFNPPSTFVTQVDRFPFSVAPFTTVDVGNLSQGQYNGAGQNSDVNGYNSGGQGAFGTRFSTINRFPFAAPFATASNIGALRVSKSSLTGVSSDTDGYIAGGPNAPAGAEEIDRFPFSSPFTTTTLVGNLSAVGISDGTGHRGDTDGYVSGGVEISVGNTDNITRFPFSAPFVNSTDIGSLSLISRGASGHQG